MEKNSFCMQPALKVHRLACMLEKRADQALQEDLGITFSQSMILLSLRDNPSCSQRCIAECRDLTQAAVSRQIDVLRTKKLLLRKENEQNRREHILKMTDKGAETLEHATRIIEKMFQEAFDVLPKAGLKEFEETMDRLIAAMRKQKEDCGCD